MEDLNRRAEQQKAEKAPNPLDLIEETAGAGKFESAVTQVEAFLKKREGETRAEFSRRVARWLAGGSASDERRMVMLEERPRTLQVMALTAVSLAEYRLAHNEYPAALGALSSMPTDRFDGKPMRYERKGKGYALWSVGMNLVDDGGSKDDIVLRAE